MLMHKVAKNVSPVCTFPAEVEQDDTLPSCFCFHTVNKCPFCELFSVTYFYIFVFLYILWVTYLFKMAPKYSAELLFRVFLSKISGDVPHGENICAK